MYYSKISHIFAKRICFAQWQRPELSPNRPRRQIYYILRMKLSTFWVEQMYIKGKWEIYQRSRERIVDSHDWLRFSRTRRPCVISANFLGIISVAWHARLECPRKSGDPRRQNYFLPKKKQIVNGGGTGVKNEEPRVSCALRIPTNLVVNYGGARCTQRLTYVPLFAYPLFSREKKDQMLTTFLQLSRGNVTESDGAIQQTVLSLIYRIKMLLKFTSI